MAEDQGGGFSRDQTPEEAAQMDAEIARVRALDTGVCDSYEAVAVAPGTTEYHDRIFCANYLPDGCGFTRRDLLAVPPPP